MSEVQIAVDKVVQARPDQIIIATVSLPVAIWERLTAHLRDDDRLASGNPEMPDTPLHARIEQFLEMLVTEWEASEYESRNDMDDDTPF